MNKFETDSVEHRIVSSVERLGLDPERSVIVGSAALVLYGVDLPQMDAALYQDDMKRPGDVDISVDATQFIELFDNGHTPTGIPAAVKPDKSSKRFSTIRADADAQTGSLPVDLITRYSVDYGSINRFDRNFRKHNQANSLVMPGTDGIRIITPEQLKKTLQHNTSFGTFSDRKYQDDLNALLRHERDSKSKF
jgi:hypothetical protein